MARLEEAVEARILAAGSVTAEDNSTLRFEIDALRAKIDYLQQEKDSLNSKLINAKLEIQALESLTDTVRQKLDDAIVRLRGVLSG